jgi:aryl-alcohol dehydrogenase-like predicted oxidoreductase
MEYLQLPDFQFPISKVGLGCMSLSGQYSQDKKILDTAVEVGINFLDTADLYQKGANEEVIGKWIRGKREKMILATKVGNQWDEKGSWKWNPSKAYILKAVEDSLRRLRTDYIDLYQLHGGTLEDPWDETLEAFKILQEQGKIRAFGISSIRPNVIRKVLEISVPATIMMQYSPLDRRPEEEIFPLLEGTKTKVLVRGTFAKGILIDKPEQNFLDYSPEEVKKIKQFILSFSFSPQAILIRFGLWQKAVGSLIIGASSSGQVLGISKALEESKEIPADLMDHLQEEIPINLYQDHR